MTNVPRGIRYFSAEDVLALATHLGFRVRDVGLLGSAAMRPQASAFGRDAYPDLVSKAAALFESLTRNHALFDGNKRMAVIVTWAFLRDNGVRVVHTEDAAYEFALAAAAGRLTFEQIRDWFAVRAQPDERS